jgi:hypothetical protein
VVDIDPTHPPALKARRSVAAVVAIKVLRRGWGGKGWGCNPQGSPLTVGQIEIEVDLDLRLGRFFSQRGFSFGEIFP